MKLWMFKRMLNKLEEYPEFEVRIREFTKEDELNIRPFREWDTTRQERFLIEYNKEDKVVTIIG